MSPAYVNLSTQSTSMSGYFSLTLFINAEPIKPAPPVSSILFYLYCF